MSRHTAPAPARHEVRRERLLEVLHHHSARPLILLLAPAGFGKSTLAASYARESGAVVAWLTLQAGDVDARFLFSRVGAALEAAFADAHLLPSLRRGLRQGADGAGLARLLLADLGRAPARFILVLDDYHVVQDADDIHQAVDVLVRGLPDFGQVVITAREAPPLSIHGLVVNEAVLVLGTQDLRFTPEETAALRRALGGDAGRYDEADGWVAGILLGGAPRQLGLTSSGPLEAYVEREVLGRLRRTEQRWLETLAVLDMITPAASARLLGPGPWKLRLATIAERCPFLAVGEDGSYRLHALVRAALANRLRRGSARRAKRAWSVARVLAEEAHDTASAVRACQELGDVDRAVDLVRQVAEEGMRAGRWSAALSALWLLSEAERRAHPDLSIIEANALLQSSRPEAAREAAESALEHGGHSGDVSVQIRALLELANIARYTGDLAAAEDWLSAADYLLLHSTLAAPERRRLEGRLLGLRGVCLAIRGQVAEAREALESAERVLQVDGTSRDLAVVQHNLGTFCNRAGDYKASRAALAACAGQFRAIGDRAMLASTQLLLGNIDVRLGNLEAAGATLARVVEEARLAGALRTEGYGLAALGAWHRANGRFSDAALNFGASLRLAEEVGERELLVRTLRQRAEVALLQNDAKLARSLLRRAQVEGQQLGPSVELPAVERALGRLRLAEGAGGCAVAHFEAALGAGHQTWDPDEHAVTLYWLGTAHLALGEAHQAESALREALKVAESSVGLSILASTAAEDPRLLEYGLRIGVAPPSLAVVERLAARRRPWSGLPTLTLEVVSETSELARLEARCLGAFALHRNGQLVDLGVRRDRGYELLALLFLHPDGLPARALADLLWPDMSPERASANLRKAVQRLRILLGSKVSVRHAALTYRLDRRLAVWADVHAFDAALSRARRATGQAAIRPLEEALELYRGPLLADTGWCWVEPFRETYKRRAVEAMLRLADLIASADLARSDALAEQVLSVQPDSRAAYEQLLRNARARHDAAAVQRLTRRFEMMLHGHVGHAGLRVVRAI